MHCEYQGMRDDPDKAAKDSITCLGDAGLGI